MHRPPALERLTHADVPNVFQLADLRTHVAVGFADQLLQLAERERTLPRQKYDGGHARPVLQQRIETVECFPPAGRGLRRDRLWGDE